jgi:tRNA (guanine-N7-)-methyltransferase
MRLRQHVNPLDMKFWVNGAGAVRLELPPEPVEVELELGCAEAQFLFQRARLCPDSFPVGLEIRRELVELVNRRARSEGSPVRAVFANANLHLPTLFPPGRLARVFVNFPDPWFKRRHHKRRVMDAQVVAALTEALRPGGELFFQSDVFDVALDAMAALETGAPGRLENRAGAWSFWKQGNPYGARSRREEACEAAGKPIWRMVYDRH